MSEIRIGRRAFLGVVGLGAVGILFGNRVSGPLQAILPGQGWRIYSINPPWPVFNPARWRLEVAGAVERPVSLSYDQLKALPEHHQTTDFHCVTGWTVDNVRWEGVPLTALWQHVRPTAQAKYVNFVSMEQPYVDTLTIAQTRMQDVILAHTMDGQPLSQAHGAPLRLVIPQMYGYKNVKWLTRIELSDKLVPGFWERNGYDVDAWVGRSNGY